MVITLPFGCVDRGRDVDSWVHERDVVPVGCMDVVWFKLGASTWCWGCGVTEVELGSSMRWDWDVHWGDITLVVTVVVGVGVSPR